MTQKPGIWAVSFGSKIDGFHSQWNVLKENSSQIQDLWVLFCDDQEEKRKNQEIPLTKSSLQQLGSSWTPDMGSIQFC